MKLTNIVVHISDSPWGCAREINKWHIQRGFKEIGYHGVILNGQILPTLFLPCLVGSIELGRPFDGDSLIQGNEIGAHALGYNDRSIGICGIGKGKWAPGQVASLITLCRTLIRTFSILPENVLGHCETESGKKEGKTCPDLDMTWLRAQLEEPLWTDLTRSGGNS